jgi:hypothetical protein
LELLNWVLLDIAANVVVHFHILADCRRHH